MGKNLFDDAQSAAFKIVTNTMGCDASWTPSDSSPVKTARVLYNDPTEKEQIDKADYDPYAYEMEYERGDLDGLKEMADELDDEEVIIDTRFGLKTFFVRKVKGKFDGNTYIATLELKP